MDMGKELRVIEVEVEPIYDRPMKPIEATYEPLLEPITETEQSSQSL